MVMCYFGKEVKHVFLCFYPQQFIKCVFDEALLDELGDDLDYDIEDEDALLADDYDVPSSTQSHAEHDDASAIETQEEFLDYEEPLDDVLDLGVTDDLDSEIQDSSEIGKTLITIQNVDNSDAETSQEFQADASQVESSQEYVETTTDVNAESEEEEEKDSEERERFKSERTNIISLKSGKMFGNIPDSLDKVITADDANKNKLQRFGNWRNRRNRGRGGGRGAFHNNNQFRVFNNTQQPFVHHSVHPGHQTFPMGQNIVNSALHPQHQQLDPHLSHQNHMLSHPPPPLLQHQSQQPHKILINPHFRGPHQQQQEYAWNSNVSVQPPPMGDGHIPMLLNSEPFPQGYTDNFAPPRLDRPPPLVQQQHLYHHEPYREQHPPMGTWQEHHPPEQNFSQQSVPMYANSQQHHELFSPPQQTTQIVLPPPNYPPPLLNQPPPQQQQTWDTQVITNPYPTVDNTQIQNFRPSGQPNIQTGSLRLRNSNPVPRFRRQQQQHQNFQHGSQNYHGGENQQNNNSVQWKQTTFFKNRLGSPQNKLVFRNIQKRPSNDNSVSPTNAKHLRFDNNLKRIKRMPDMSNLHEVPTVDTLPDTTVSESFQQQVEPEPEDEETREYRKKIEEQKKLREKLLAQKEERRRLAALEKKRQNMQAGINIMAAGDATSAQNSGNQGKAISTIVNKNPAFTTVKVLTNPGVSNSNLTLVSSNTVLNKQALRGRGRGGNLTLQRAAVLRQQVLQKKILQQKALKVIQTQGQIVSSSSPQPLNIRITKPVLNQIPKAMAAGTSNMVTISSSQQQQQPPRRVVIAPNTAGGQKVLVSAVKNKPAPQNVTRTLSVMPKRTVTIKTGATSQQPTTGQRVVVQQGGTLPQNIVRRVKVGSTTTAVEAPTLPRTKVVSIDNLAASTTETNLKRLCQGIGPLEKFQMFKQQRKAVVTFKNPASAAMFFKRYQRKMVDLSLINITLVDN